MDNKVEHTETNEQIIDELTKDLENSYIKVDENSASNDSTKESTTVKTSNLAANSGIHVEGNSNNDNESETQLKSNIDRPDDSVDEDLLKDRDLTLSDSEKENLKNEAEKYKIKGNDFFKNEEYEQAICMYTQGLQTCPLAYSKERSILYANRAAAKLKCLDKESAINDCTKAIELNPSYVRAYVRRAQLYEETEKLDEALEDFKKVLTFDPGHTQANHEVRRLPPLIHEKNEKLKAEMLGKLKDLGNMFLKPFGLSTNNFELQKDPNSGGYSVKFNQNTS